MAGRSRTTMAEIAEKSGVSVATVSLVLRDKPGVGVETRERVLEIAKSLGYIPKSSNVQYRASLTNVGLILKAEPDRIPQANQFYSRVLAGIEAICRQQQINLLYATVPVDQDSHPLELPRLLVEGDSVDGLLFVGAYLDEPFAKVIERHSAPVVLVDAYAASDQYDAVVSDNTNGAYQAVAYLARQLGHKHIGLVGSREQAYPSIQERRQGYIQALQDNSISEYYFADCHISNQEEIFEATTDLLRRNPQITALFGANDEVAITAMDAARALNRQIPDDLSLVGFDDIELSRCVSPSLSTVRIDKSGMGRLAMSLLMDRVAYPHTEKVKAVIGHKLIIRDSVKRLACVE